MMKIPAVRDGQVVIVVGAQYGGEGKGKIASAIARKERFDLVCRCGGVNSSHTVITKGRKYRLRLMPASACLGLKYQRFLFGAGTLLHVPTLMSEIEQTGVDHGRVVIDPKAGIVTDDCIQSQRNDDRYSRIGSTMTGTGYASAQRCLRKLPLARDIAELRPYLGAVSEEISGALLEGKNVLVEGHQGYGLSNYHGDYPYTSSRDATAAAMMSELGIGPAHKIRVVMAVKIFPTRNHNGVLRNEISSAQADGLGIYEFGGGSWGIDDRRRRVGQIDFDEVKKAAVANTPSEIALMGGDYWRKSFRGARFLKNMSQLDRRHVMELASRFSDGIGYPVTMISTGPETEAMIFLKAAWEGDVQGLALFNGMEPRSIKEGPSVDGRKRRRSPREEHHGEA